MTLFSFNGDKAISSDANATITQKAGSDKNNSSIYLDFFDGFGVGFSASLAAASAAALAAASCCLDSVLMVFL